MASAEAAGAAALRVCVVCAAPDGTVDAVAVELPAGACVADALSASGLARRHPGFDPARSPLGVWGVRCTPQRRLDDGDRVEVYRALCVDPKQARRTRQRHQQAKSRRAV